MTGVRRVACPMTSCGHPSALRPELASLTRPYHLEAMRLATASMLGLAASAYGYSSFMPGSGPRSGTPSPTVALRIARFAPRSDHQAASWRQPCRTAPADSDSLAASKGFCAISDVTFFASRIHSSCEAAGFVGAAGASGRPAAAAAAAAAVIKCALAAPEAAA